MIGPERIGYWSGKIAPNNEKTHQHLVAGRRYRVVKKFSDYDQHWHLPNEEWTFLGASFLSYESGVSLFVSVDPKAEWHIRLQWENDEQQEVLDSLHEYIEEIQHHQASR